jgi:hypothetical protein
MLLKELLHKIEEDKVNNLINIDEWNFSDVDYLISMGFDYDGDYYITLSDPQIRICKRRTKEEGKNVFLLKEKDKPLKIFKKFEDIIYYFDNYRQPEIDKE